MAFGRKQEPVVDQQDRTHVPGEGPRDGELRRGDDRLARDKFGGANIGAAFFGWLVAVGMTVLLTGILAAVATAVGYSGTVSLNQAQDNAESVGLGVAIALFVVLLLAYYSGGYVAGRMSRFDGGRQGLLVWVIALVVTVVAAVLGVLAGDQYNVLDRVDVPRLGLPGGDVTTAGVVGAVVLLVGTLLAAMAGGKVGQRYHRRVDRAL
ncbi:hypothetical protein SAMN04488570_3114 [Nocardioides scoriae]|uniref:Uncharacterized protein n=1 Tax=Nocardioides scoriae TaxID=642780 RepID=A0A1H1WFF3_9ACTN|nr:hypothetical protein [Nocardioides scoriae]SDS94889.1 hypothetical protein SAMN04488570_3114 [Nocardioides scoriae]